ncbi:hypothetical protein [Bdellovibrio sp. KM01]|uniref:hypothetical protein n=1 Tax=Bdellovibrio sp. KM01 TaxID=2748865 RepID=UPI0015EAD7D2|nr:hypothetical protein [Bdellovibrio sp. KM01]QLY25772.1 hypothetical protein HW988_01600 [Bdellovibrio sp. KM01]
MNRKTMLMMALVLGGLSAQAHAADPYFAQRQVDAIKSQESLIRNGIASGQISKDLCIYFVQGLADMRKSAYVIAAATGGESSQLNQISQLKTMNIDECK